MDIIVSFSYVNSALNAHFKHDSIMINIKGTNPSEILNNASFNYYFVDEPNESEINETDIWAYSQNISSKNVNGKLLLSDYMWPYRSLPCYFASGDLDMMNEYLRYSNEYIMCDQYEGNGCGDATDFWNEYKSVYGIPSKNLTNWITLKQSVSYDWDNLLNMASSWSSVGAMNPIWIYGGGGSGARSEERRVGKECRSRWSPYH